MTSTAISGQGSTLQIGTTTGSAKTVTAIILGYPTQVTSTAHGLANGDLVTLAAFAGADAALLNGVSVTIENVTANTFAFEINTVGKTVTATAATATPLSWAKVGNLKTFSGFDGKPSELDTTNCDSTGKEFLPGLVDYGNFTAEVDQLNVDVGQAAVLVALQGTLVKTFKLTLPNTNTATFSAFVTQFTSSGGVDQIVKRTIGLRITGAVAWA